MPDSPCASAAEQLHHCPPCDRGDLMPGHCIDIDGYYWHQCFATRLDQAAADREASRAK